jgi:hypothetical protein
MRIGIRIVDVHCPECQRSHQISLEKMLGLIHHDCPCGHTIDLDFDGTLTRSIIKSNEQLDHLVSMLEDLTE